MYYTLKRVMLFISSVVFAMTFCACSVSRPGVDISENRYETDNAVIEIQIPEFKNFPDNEFEEKLNSDYRSAVNKWVEDFNAQCSENLPEKGRFSLAQRIALRSAPFISVVGEIYIFTEGIHGTSSRVTKNIDTERNVELKLSDLFSDNSYEEMINRKITEILEKNKEQYSDLWEKPRLTAEHQECFYLSEDGLVIYYPPYELSYYARGFVEFCIPYSELSGYLKDEYRGCLK